MKGKWSPPHLVNIFVINLLTKLDCLFLLHVYKILCTTTFSTKIEIQNFGFYQQKGWIQTYTSPNHPPEFPFIPNIPTLGYLARYQSANSWMCHKLVYTVKCFDYQGVSRRIINTFGIVTLFIKFGNLLTKSTPVKDSL